MSTNGRLTSYGYCFALSGLFVGCLYAVPKRLRNLDRNDPRQIKVRTMATTAVSVASILVTPVLFPTANKHVPSPTIVSSLSCTTMVVLHAGMLYLGPIAQMMAFVSMDRTNNSSLISWFSSQWYNRYVRPIWRSFTGSPPHERWVCLRNRVIAPLTEEMVFRTAMVPVLRNAGNPVGRTSWVAPLFFGTAHIHHALVQIFRHGESASRALVVGMFQFTYTTLFGAYATYVYCKTGSTIAVVVVHSFCNGMGLPTMEFLRPLSPLQKWHQILWTAHVSGILLFSWGFWNLPIFVETLA